MNIQQIEYTVSVAEYKYFGVAAEKCFVTQSTLSTMIGKLEDEIGINIFNRKTKPVSITKEGQAIITKFKTILQELDQFKELTSMLKGELKGEIRIGVIPTIAPYILPKFLNDFAKSYPLIQFIVSEMTTEVLVGQIKSRELDIGIAALPLYEDDIIEHQLYHEEFLFYDCRENRIDNPIEMNHLDTDHFWVMEDGHCLSTQTIQICRLKNKYKKNINFDFKAGSIDSLIRFVKENNGITLLPELATLDFNKEEKKKLSKVENPAPVRAVGLICHSHFVKKKVMDLLIKEIKDKVKPLLHSDKYSGKVISPL